MGWAWWGRACGGLCHRKRQQAECEEAGTPGRAGATVCHASVPGLLCSFPPPSLPSPPSHCPSLLPSLPLPPTVPPSCPPFPLPPSLLPPPPFFPSFNSFMTHLPCSPPAECVPFSDFQSQSRTTITTVNSGTFSLARRHTLFSCRPPHPHPSPDQPLIYFLSPWICLFWTFHADGITQRVASRDRLLPLRGVRALVAAEWAAILSPKLPKGQCVRGRENESRKRKAVVESEAQLEGICVIQPSFLRAQGSGGRVSPTETSFGSERRVAGAGPTPAGAVHVRGRQTRCPSLPLPCCLASKTDLARKGHERYQNCFRKCRKVHICPFNRAARSGSYVAVQNCRVLKRPGFLLRELGRQRSKAHQSPKQPAAAPCTCLGFYRPRDGMPEAGCYLGLQGSDSSSFHTRPLDFKSVWKMTPLA